MPDVLEGRRIALGVTGSIAAYKAVAVASRLVQAGAVVDVLMTRAATELVRPLSFQAITHRPVVTDLWAPTGQMGLDHISIARGIDALLVAPATADLIARLASGRADDALTTTALATRVPLLVAPAMEPQMWSHPATQGNAAVLRERGVTFIGPEAGRMASGVVGVGRMTSPDAVVEQLRARLAQVIGGALAGRRVLVTAGPTREALDPVRYLSNHSSGAMGYAVARAARDRAARVTLVTGPVALAPPFGIAVVRVESATDMLGAVLAALPDADIVVMTAAVADYRPTSRAARKIKKRDADLALALQPNADILLEIDRALGERAHRPVRVGFAAETDDLVVNARAKLLRKGVDLVVGNPVPATFGSDDIDAVLVTRDATEVLGVLAKAELAALILDRVTSMLSTGG